MIQSFLTLSLLTPTHRLTAKQLILGFDWVGVFLFIGSLTIFIFGLDWGGSL